MLIGNPNVGKSTLFNRLTGARQRVVNAPRTTVEVATGSWRDPALPGGEVTLTDLPGTYDIKPSSPDERVATTALLGGTDGRRAAAAIVAVDATALGRSLYLLGQVRALGIPTVVALTMADVALTRGVAIDPARLARAVGSPVVTVDPRKGHGRAALADAVNEALRGGTPEVLTHDTDALEWADRAVRIAYGDEGRPEPRRTLTDRVDAVLLTPWVGIPVFAAVLWGMLQLVTTAATPLMTAVDSWWSSAVLGGSRWLIPGDGWWEQAVVDGVLAGVGVVVSFAPLMALTFVALAILEDSGYLARAAIVADRGMRAMGLNGQATLPLIIGFGCNLPALAALKTLPSRRQRLATGLLIPFTSCTARLPVYLLLASAFFPRYAGTVVFAMYALSATVVVLGGLVMKRTVLRGRSADSTIMVLPAYQRPNLRALGLSAWTRTRAFVTRAGTVIVMALCALWLLSAIPAPGSHGGFAAVRAEDSVYGATAAAVAPVFAPAGFDDWRLSAALVSGFVAKEIVVGTLAQSYALDEPAEPGADPSLNERLRDTLDASSGGHGPAAALAFLAFVLMYTPCVATLGELRRQLGSRWMLTAVAIGLTSAYLTAVLVFQIGRAL